MSNIMAAIGLVQLKKFPMFKEKRRLLAKIYQKKLSEFVKLVDCNYDEVVPHIFVNRVGEGKRDMVKAALTKEGIPTGMHYRPNHLLTLFCNNQDNVTLKHTDKVYEELITLPLHPGLTEEHINFICDVIKHAIQTR